MSSSETGCLRSRTVAWQDPQISARQAGSISGLDYLRGLRDRKIEPPPVGLLLGYRLVEVEPGHATFELEPAEFHYNPFASVHGGVISTLLDSAMTCAVLTTLPAGVGCTTLEIKVNFVRPMTERTGVVRCKARTIHTGRRIAIAEGRVVDARDKLYAHAVTTCVIFDAKEKGA